MDKCLQHTKESVGLCMWCGKKLCEKCIQHKEGRKLYCEKCAGLLNPISRLKIAALPQAILKKNGDTQWI